MYIPCAEVSVFSSDLIEKAWLLCEGYLSHWRSATRLQETLLHFAADACWMIVPAASL